MNFFHGYRKGGIVDKSGASLISIDKLDKFTHPIKINDTDQPKMMHTYQYEC
jgi:hypothetical protein